MKPLLFIIPFWLFSAACSEHTVGSVISEPQWTVSKVYDSPLPNNYILSLAVDADNSVWMGNYYGRLTHFDGTNWTSYNSQDSSIPDDEKNYRKSFRGHHE